MATVRSVIYARSASGGQAAVRTHEHNLRHALALAGIAHKPLHVYRDVNTHGTSLGTALLTLLSDAAWSLVHTVYVTDLLQLGSSHQLLLHVLRELEETSANVVTLEDLHELSGVTDPHACDERGPRAHSVPALSLARRELQRP